MMTELIRATQSQYSHILITEDFNYSNIDWEAFNTPHDSDSIESKFLECIKDCFLHQHVYSPTHYRGNQTANVLDLVFTNEETMIEGVDLISPLGKSHHSGLLFLFKCYSIRDHSITTKPIYSKGDYDKIRNELGSIDWEKELKGKNTNETFLCIKTRIEEQIFKHIPLRKPKRGHTSKPFWMNQTALAKVRKKHKAYKRYLQTKNGKEYGEYARARNQARWEIRKAKREYEKQLANISKSNPKAFYNYANSKLKTRQGVSNLRRDDGTTTNSDQEKASELNKFFSSVFTDEDSDVPTFSDRHNDVLLESVEIKEKDVYDYLKDLNASKSPGPDGLHPRVLKEACHELTTPFTILYRRSLSEGVVPKEWKDAHITPIFKKGNRAASNNYRPVSLTSLACKVMEKIIRKKTIEHLKRHMSESQHGFTQGRSCMTQLVESVEVWTRLLDDGIPIDVVYLDFAKAFDSVPHQRLLIKLESYGIKGNLLKWVKDFLLGRRQRVVVNGVPSSWASVDSGIPQGSVLGPLLFICYVNDMPEIVTSMIKMFADYTKLFAECKNDEDREKLQSDLESLQEWSRTWQIRFNADKCKVMHMGRGNSKYEYQMSKDDNPVTLASTDCEKDLGVYIDNELKFRSHIDRVSKKANCILGLIRRSFEFIDKGIFKTLFTSLVRPHLEYGNIIWSPYYKKDIKVIENVQRRGSKMVPELKDLGYEERLKRLSLPSLVYRRFRGDMIETYKYIHGYYDVKSVLNMNTYGKTKGHNLKIFNDRYNTNVRKRVYSVRVAHGWNRLPRDIVNAKSLNCFKNKLDDYCGERKYSCDPPFI